jgi:hypothetical protein
LKLQRKKLDQTEVTQAISVAELYKNDKNVPHLDLLVGVA